MGRDRKNEIRGEHFARLTRAMLETPAWRALPNSAKALYPLLKLEWHGAEFNNNGKIRLSVRQAAAGLGVSRNTAAKAFHALQAHGFIVVKREAHLGVDGHGRSTEYELTEIAMRHSQTRGGRALYKDWRPGRNYPIVRCPTKNAKGKNGKTKPCHLEDDEVVIRIATKGKRASSN